MVDIFCYFIMTSISKVGVIKAGTMKPGSLPFPNPSLIQKAIRLLVWHATGLRARACLYFVFVSLQSSPLAMQWGVLYYIFESIC